MMFWTLSGFYQDGFETLYIFIPMRWGINYGNAFMMSVDNRFKIYLYLDQWHDV